MYSCFYNTRNAQKIRCRNGIILLHNTQWLNVIKCGYRPEWKKRMDIVYRLISIKYNLGRTWENFPLSPVGVTVSTPETSAPLTAILTSHNTISSYSLTHTWNTFTLFFPLCRIMELKLEQRWSISQLVYSNLFLNLLQT